MTDLIAFGVSVVALLVAVWQRWHDRHLRKWLRDREDR